MNKKAVTFQGRELLIATKHGKEQVIAPLFEKSLGVSCFTPSDLDTDLLGTFSGETERIHDPLTTLRNKCLMAIEKYACDLVIASEGSFGSHPTYFWTKADEEIIMLMDTKNSLEITARVLSSDTNLNAATVSTEAQLREFAETSGFPSHALIIRQASGSLQNLCKGIHSEEVLLKKFKAAIRKQGSVHLETDMRAHHNPTRMKVIAQVCEKLLEHIHSQCPQCQTPGFQVTDVERGLLCSSCGEKTESILCHIYTCQSCRYVLKKKYPNDVQYEDPMYCQQCNP